MTDLQKLSGALCQLMPLQDDPADFIDLENLDILDKEFYLVRVVFQFRDEKTPRTEGVYVRRNLFEMFDIASVAKRVMEQCIKTP